MTDERMKALANRLETVYREALQTAVKNEQVWIDKLASLPADSPLEKRTAFANEAIRRGEQVKRISAEIAKAGDTARNIINGEMTNIYGLNYDFSNYSINRLTGLDLDWTVYDRNQIGVLMQENQSPFTKIAYNNLENSTEISRRLQNQLLQGTVLGESQQKIIQRIRSVTGYNAMRAKRIAQTERVRVQSEARFKGMEEAAEMGLGMQKQWHSRMDERVRDDHAAITGDIVDYDEPFANGLMFPGDPNGEPAEVINCRCAMKELVKSTSPALAAHREKFNRDMGFDEWREQRLSRRDTAKIRENYRSEFKGLQTSNGITVKAPSAHFIEQSAKRGISAENAAKALTSPLYVGKIRIDDKGRPSQTFIGKQATVSINPDTGILATTYSTGSRRRRKYGGNDEAE